MMKSDYSVWKRKMAAQEVEGHSKPNVYKKMNT